MKQGITVEVSPEWMEYLNVMNNLPSIIEEIKLDIERLRDNVVGLAELVGIEL